MIEIWNIYENAILESKLGVVGLICGTNSWIKGLFSKRGNNKLTINHHGTSW